MSNINAECVVAEVGGFEPSRRFHALTVFKTVLFNHLSTPPNIILLLFSMIYNGPSGTRTLDTLLMREML